MKQIVSYSVAILACLLASCNKGGEAELLKTKVYFEHESTRLEVGENKDMSYDLQARVSSPASSAVDLSYALAGADEVKAYNLRHGTEYQVFDQTKAKLESNTSSIKSGEVYASKVNIQISGLDALEAGKPYLLPIRIESASLPHIEGRNITYLVLFKPVRITKALTFENHGIRVGFPIGTTFTSLTYEALVRISRFGGNNTIMGREGRLIFRVGDEGGGTPRNQPQIAGTKEFKSPKTLEAGQWYHMAFSYDQPSGKATMYINGAKVSEANWDTPSFDFGGDIFIGKVVGFMWGERPFFGAMSEVRFWNVARTENQIRENMLSVDPKSEGLAAYYKMNGADQVQEGDKWVIKDASGHKVDGTVYRGRSGLAKLGVVELDTPIAIN